MATALHPIVQAARDAAALAQAKPPAPAPVPPMQSPSEPTAQLEPVNSVVSKYLRTTKSEKAYVLIYGPPVSGKTTGARTFPNPYIVDFDGNLPPGTPNVIPMWDDAFVDSLKPRPNPNWPACRMDLLLILYTDLARNLPAGSTIITDSLTRIETWYNIEEAARPPILSEKGKVDTRAMWGIRLKYFDTLFTTLTTCAANVVFISHQQSDRDEKGNVIQQLRPSLMGQIGEKLPGYFPTVLQAQRLPNAKGGVDYVWATQPSIIAPARVPKPCTVPHIPQQYSELVKYL